MKISLSSCKNNDIDICSDRNLSDLEYAEDAVLFSEDPNELQVLLDCLNDSMCGMRFALWKCGMLLRGCIGSKPNLVEREQLNWVDRFSYLCSCISPGGRT